MPCTKQMLTAEDVAVRMQATPRRILAALAVSATLIASGCGETEPSSETEDLGPIHVHGLGVNPADGALFIATHTGLFRAAPGETEASRVGENHQDTMGFTVVGPNRFLGSGHPGGDADFDLPPFLGLIESRDAGDSWKSVSLLGKSDFHVLESRGRRVYGFGTDWKTREAQFLVSSDAGQSWSERSVPEPLLSLALHPEDANRLIASGESGIYGSDDGGQNWQRHAEMAGLVAWHSTDQLILVDPDGVVHSSEDATRWSEIGEIGGQPAAFESEPDGLYVALHDGTVKHSSDGGASWDVRSSP